MTDMPVTRRSLMAGAMLLPLLASGAVPFSTPARAAGGSLLLHDPSLAAGRRFAAQAAKLNVAPIAIEGDRVRFLRTLLTEKPQAIYGVTRHSDQLLLGEIAREAGYRAIAIIQHRTDGVLSPRCQPNAAAIGTIAANAGSRWPEAFAELAIGGVGQCSVKAGEGLAEPAISWVLMKS